MWHILSDPPRAHQLCPYFTAIDPSMWRIISSLKVKSIWTQFNPIIPLPKLFFYTSHGTHALHFQALSMLYRHSKCSSSPLESILYFPCPKQGPCSKLQAPSCEPWSMAPDKSQAVHTNPRTWKSDSDFKKHF